MTRLKEKFNNEISAELVKKFNYSSVMEVPKIEKIVVNMGIGDAVQNSKVLDSAVEELQAITGQKPLVTKAKNLLRLSVFVKVCQSVQKLHYVEKECMNSLIN